MVQKINLAEQGITIQQECQGMNDVDFILRDLEYIKKNDHTRIYDDSQVFARALIYLLKRTIEPSKPHISYKTAVIMNKYLPKEKQVDLSIYPEYKASQNMNNESGN